MLKKKTSTTNLHTQISRQTHQQKKTNVFLKPHLISARCSSSDFLGSKSEGFQDLAAKTLCFPNCGGVGLVALPPQLLGVAEIGWCCYKWQCPRLFCHCLKKRTCGVFFSSFANKRTHPKPFLKQQKVCNQTRQSMSVDMIEKQKAIGDAFSTSFCLFINMAFAESTCCTFTTRFRIESSVRPLQ